MGRQPVGSKKWRTSQWKRLLELVLPALDELPNELTWSLGGGTALSISLNHRISYDIDIFFQDASALKFLWKRRPRSLQKRFITGDLNFQFVTFLTSRPFQSSLPRPCPRSRPRFATRSQGPGTGSSSYGNGTIRRSMTLYSLQGLERNLWTREWILQLRPWNRRLPR